MELLTGIKRNTEKTENVSVRVTSASKNKLVKMQKYLKTSQSEIIEHLIDELWKEVSQEAKTKRKRPRKRKSS